MQRIVQVVEVLAPEGKIEAELIVNTLDQFRGGPAPEHGNRRVARDQPYQHEDDEADADEHRDHLQQPPCSVAHHAAATPPSMVRAEPVTKRASSDAR